MAVMIPSLLQGMTNKFASGESSSLFSDSDIISTISFKTSPVILGVGLLIVSYMQFVETPMSCWYSDMKLEWQNFIDDFCWLDSYYHPSIRLKNNETSRHLARQIDLTRYQYAAYQWVPFVLAIQMILFYIPHVIWEAIFLRSSLNPTEILRVALMTSVTTTPNERSIKLNELREIFNPFIKVPIGTQLELPKWNKTCCSKDSEINVGCCKFSLSKVIRKHRGVFLMLASYFIKIVYITNAVGQIILISQVYQTSSVFYGIDVFARLHGGNSSEMPESFPRVIYCDLILQGKVSVTEPIQCTIKLNMFNEKFHTFLWFWCSGLAICGTLILLYDIFRQATLTTTKGFIHKDLKLLRDRETKENRLRALVFVREQMRRDGIHLLDIISSQVSQMVVGELVIVLWKEWVGQVMKKLTTDTDSVSSKEFIENIDTNCVEVDEPHETKDMVMVSMDGSNKENKYNSDHVSSAISKRQFTNALGKNSIGVIDVKDSVTEGYNNNGSELDSDLIEDIINQTNRTNSP